MIGAPEHGKYVVDGINTCDNRYLMGKMCMIGTLEADNKESRMNSHSMVGSASYSLAKELKRLCGDEVKVNGFKEHSTHKKREKIQN